jgi:hypothetical protein
MKTSPRETAAQFVRAEFAHCSAAIMGGSAAREEYTEHSDLDLVIVDHTIPAPSHEIYRFGDWDIEVFAFCGGTYEDFFQENAREGIPTLQRICAEGILIVDRGGEGMRLQERAKKALAAGPVPWTLDDMNRARFELTNLLLDLTAAKSYAEAVFVANELAKAAHHFILRIHGRWTGFGKWMIRELERFDEQLCRQFIAVFTRLYQTGEIDQVVAWIDELLAPYGGRLLAGFRESSVLAAHADLQEREIFPDEE